MKLFLFSALASTALFAQPVIRTNGVVNAASYTQPGLPGANIAPGSIFVVFGSGMGPSTLVQSSGFPVPTTLAGTSLTVTQGTRTYQPYIFYTSATQIAAVMPSTLGPGTSSLTVTYNGQTSGPALFTPQQHGFGIFTQNSSGTGPAIVTNASVRVNGIDTLVTPTTPMKPTDVGIIWGTGLGYVTGDEAGSPRPGDQTYFPVEVSVGGKPAALTYRGRSGCCAGLDQIAFVVPEGVTGCNVPVSVKTMDGVGRNPISSNFPSIAVSADGSACTDQFGISSGDYKRLSAAGNVSIGSITLTRTNIELPLPPPLPSVTNTSDIGAGLFETFTFPQYALFQNPTNFSVPGACTVFTYKGTTATYVDPIQPALLDAGDMLTVTGPTGVKTLVKGSATGLQYSRTLGNVTTGLPSGTPLFLSQGPYTVSGTGGAGVGAFSASIVLPDPLVWTNKAAVSTLDRLAGQTVTWTGGDQSGSVVIIGFSTVKGANAGVEFLCSERASAGTFTIPSSVLIALPAQTVGSITSAASVTGALGVGFQKSNTFTATGIDIGTIVGLSLDLKVVSYK